VPSGRHPPPRKARRRPSRRYGVSRPVPSRWCRVPAAGVIGGRARVDQRPVRGHARAPGLRGAPAVPSAPPGGGRGVLVASRPMRFSLVVLVVVSGLVLLPGLTRTGF